MKLHISAILLIAFILAGCATATKQLAPGGGVETELQSKAIVVVGTQCRGGDFCGSEKIGWGLYSDDQKKVIPGGRFDVLHDGSIFGSRKKTHVVAVEPGTYALLDAALIGTNQRSNRTIYNMATLKFKARAGEVVYIGDYIISFERQGGTFTGWPVIDLSRTSDPAGAKKFITEKYSPGLSQKLKEIIPTPAAFRIAGLGLGVMWSVAPQEKDQPPWQLRHKRIRSNQELTFPFKPNLTSAQLEQDVRSCNKLSLNGGLDSSLDTRSEAGAFAVQFLVHLLVGSSSKSGGTPLTAGNFRNCMLLHGYDMVQVPESIKFELEGLSPLEQLQRIREFVAETDIALSGVAPVEAVRSGTTTAMLDVQPQLLTRRQRRQNVATAAESTQIASRMPIAGEWVGEITETGSGCDMSLTAASASIENKILKLRLLRGRKVYSANLGLAGGRFSEWKTLNMSASIVDAHGGSLGEKRFRLPAKFTGRVEGGRIVGNFAGDVGRAINGSNPICSAAFTLTRGIASDANTVVKRSQPARPVPLRELAGDWVGVVQNNVSDANDCFIESGRLSANITDGQLRLNYRTKSFRHRVVTKVKPKGIVSDWMHIQFDNVRTGRVGNSTAMRLNGRFTADRFEGAVFKGDFEAPNYATRCSAEILLARKGTRSAASLAIGGGFVEASIPTQSTVTSRPQTLSTARSNPPVTISGFKHEFVSTTQMHMNVCERETCVPGAMVSYSFFAPEKNPDFEKFKRERKTLQSIFRAHAQKKGEGIRFGEPNQTSNELFTLFTSERETESSSGAKIFTKSTTYYDDNVTLTLISSAPYKDAVEANGAQFLIGLMAWSQSKINAANQ